MPRAKAVPVWPAGRSARRESDIIKGSIVPKGRIDQYTCLDDLTGKKSPPLGELEVRNHLGSVTAHTAAVRDGQAAFGINLLVDRACRRVLCRIF